jgi:hypothetical protein
MKVINKYWDSELCLTKIKINENAHKGFILKRLDKLDKKRGVEAFPLKELVFF